MKINRYQAVFDEAIKSLLFSHFTLKAIKSRFWDRSYALIIILCLSKVMSCTTTRYKCCGCTTDIYYCTSFTVERYDLLTLL